VPMDAQELGHLQASADALRDSARSIGH